MTAPRHSQELAKVLTAHFGEDAGMVGVEVGVHRGETSRHLLETFGRLTLVLVDSWRAYPVHDEHTRLSDATQEQFDAWRMAAVAATDGYYDRRIILHRTSRSAVHRVVKLFRSVSFAFIDAAHDRESVADNLDDWWPVIRPRGLLCGHDYHGSFPGVVAAVDAFAQQRGLSIRKHPRSLWSIAKP